MPTTYQDTNDGFLVARLVKIIIGVIILLVGLWGLHGITGHNDNQNWQICQYPNGKIVVVGDGGYYLKWFGNVWTYPKYIQLDYTEEKTREYPNDESVTVTFNDGGNSKMSSMVRIATPVTDEKRLTFHQQLPDKDGTHSAVRAAVKAHLVNCLKSTGPLMSSSEHQTARKSEYTQVVQEQLDQGLFEMKRVERVLKDTFDAQGKPITVFATEVILNAKGLPAVAQPSPLHELGVDIKQFSIVGTTYDEQTLAQFKVKKEAFLATENSKAQREKEVQERLMVEERGRRMKAEIEAESNKVMAAATIKANQEKTVAETLANQEKVVAETNAAKLVAVATQNKIAAETLANQEKSVAETAATRELEVAKLNRQAAEENAKKIVALAEAQQKALQVAGAISEHDRVLAEISRDRDIQVATALAKIQVPSVVIGGSGATGTGTTANEQGVTQQLMNISMLRSMGVLKNP